MKTLLRLLLLAVPALLVQACSTGPGKTIQAEDPAIIPVPVSMKITDGTFTITPGTPVFSDNKELSLTAAYLATSLGGLELKDGRGTGINLEISASEITGIGEEGYRLEVTKKGITVTANKAAGVFYGVQSLLQMLPAWSACAEDKQHGIPVKCAVIEDFPRFKWRGLLLDVSRHFFTIGEIKMLIDQMSVYKFNVLQLHLTDDQGWRLEIKSMPELTNTGAWRVPRTGLWWDRKPPRKDEKASYGGFYTHEQIKDLVNYASGKHINILPEIEAPGHSLAAIASYPYLSSTGLNYSVNPGSKFYTTDDNSLCPGKESTFEYMDKVFTEVAELFPFEYIHIGGDECYKGFWEKCPDCRRRVKDNGLSDMKELQSYFVKRLEKILESKGKKLIGWDEILEGGLAPNAAVMSWRGMEGGIAAAKAGHAVVMSPVDYAYIDYYQGDPAGEPPTFAMLRLNKVYQFEPVPEGLDSTLILGGQGNLWSESVPNFRHAEYMFWPRSFALAEVFWSPRSSRDWKDFVRRTEINMKRLENKDINFSKSLYDPAILPEHDKAGNLLIKLETELDNLSLYYTFDNTFPDRHSSLYKTGELLSIPEDADGFRVISYRDGKPLGKMITVSLSDLEKRVQ